MSQKMDALTFIEQVVLITKNYQNAEGELKSHFEDLLEAVIQKIIQLLSQFEEMGDRSQQAKDLLDMLIAFLVSKEREYNSTIGGSQYI